MGVARSEGNKGLKVTNERNYEMRTLQVFKARISSILSFKPMVSPKSFDYISIFVIFIYSLYYYSLYVHI